MARIAYLTTIDFGPGELATLPAAVAEFGLSRPLLISDRGIEASGLLARVAALFEGTPKFLETPPNPTEAAWRRRWRSGGTRAATGSWRSGAGRRSTSPRGWRCWRRTRGR